MKITFFSNFLNSHQLPLCEAIIQNIGVENFKFVATTKIAQDRIDMGFVDMNEKYPFVVKAYESKEKFDYSYELAKSSDVAIIGSASYLYSDVRMKRNMLTFNYTERLFKRGRWQLLYPPKLRRVIHFYTLTRNKPNYVLGASAYTKEDVAFCGFPKSKCFKWGYFPELSTDEPIDVLFERKRDLERQIPNILWTGRFISWKHPENAIYLAEKLMLNGVEFHLDMIGSGPQERFCKELTKKLKLLNYVHFHGALTPIEVKDYMKKSNIFIFTSDKNEGWGAVLNEAMSCGCAVVANKAIGSVPFLIKDGYNGFVYNNDIKEAYDRLFDLIKSSELRQLLGKNAYDSIKYTWNAKQAGDNLMKLIDCIINGRDLSITDGPCSRA